MALKVERLPRFLVLEPTSTVRFDLQLAGPACEVDVGLENPGPGRSFLLMVGSPDGPLPRRLQLSRGARIVFGAADARPQVLLLANPQQEPLVLQLRGRSTATVRPRPRRPPPSRVEGQPRVRLTVEVPEPKGREILGPPVGAGLRRARPKG